MLLRGKGRFDERGHQLPAVQPGPGEVRVRVGDRDAPDYRGPGGLGEPRGTHVSGFAGKAGLVSGAGSGINRASAGSRVRPGLPRGGFG